MNTPASNLPPSPARRQLDHVTREQLRRLAAAQAAGSRGITFLELWNGGGLIALLSYWGAVPEIRDYCAAKLSLLAFLLGLLFLAVTVIVDYELTRRDYERFNALSGSYFDRTITWGQLWSMDHASRSRLRIMPAASGYLSALLALIGTLAGAFAVLSR